MKPSDPGANTLLNLFVSLVDNHAPVRIGLNLEINQGCCKPCVPFDISWSALDNLHYLKKISIYLDTISSWLIMKSQSIF